MKPFLLCNSGLFCNIIWMITTFAKYSINMNKLALEIVLKSRNLETIWHVVLIILFILSCTIIDCHACYYCWSFCMHQYIWHHHMSASTAIYCDACLHLSIIVHVSLPISPPYMKAYMYCCRPWYMLMIVDHRACIVIHDTSLVSMYCRTLWYVLMIVYHRACIDNPAIITYVGMYHCRPRWMLMTWSSHMHRYLCYLDM